MAIHIEVLALLAPLYWQPWPTMAQNIQGPGSLLARCFCRVCTGHRDKAETPALLVQSYVDTFTHKMNVYFSTALFRESEVCLWYWTGSRQEKETIVVILTKII